MDEELQRSQHSDRLTPDLQPDVSLIETRRKLGRKYKTEKARLSKKTMRGRIKANPTLANLVSMSDPRDLAFYHESAAFHFRQAAHYLDAGQHADAERHTRAAHEYCLNAYQTAQDDGSMLKVDPSMHGTALRAGSAKPVVVPFPCEE